MTLTVATQTLAFIDRTRPIRPSRNFAGAQERRLDTMLWYPADGDAPADGSPFPLILYCHGTYGSADNAAYLARALAADGAIVAAPQFPLTSCAAFTEIDGADIRDADEQVRDVAFLIDRLLADPGFGPSIDPARIATIGHSLGAITCWFASFGAATRDPRIVASVMLGAGDPVLAAGHLGIDPASTKDNHTAALLISADEDLFARMTGPLGVAYTRLSAPRFELTIRGGTHLWFLDGHDDAGGNPDRDWFAQNVPGQPLPADRAHLIGADRQHAITLAATRAFLATAFGGDGAAYSALEAMPECFPETELAHDA